MLVPDHDNIIAKVHCFLFNFVKFSNHDDTHFLWSKNVEIYKPIIILNIFISFDNR